MIKNNHNKNINDTKFGFKAGDLSIIINVLQAHPKIKQALIFGSRAKGNYKHGSDIDLAIKGDIDAQTLAAISFTLNEDTSLPYEFDVLDYASLNNLELKNHIDRIGVIIYDCFSFNYIKQQN